MLLYRYSTSSITILPTPKSLLLGFPSRLPKPTVGYVALLTGLHSHRDYVG